MEQYDYDALREYYHALVGLKDVFEHSANSNSTLVESNLIAEYEELLSDADDKLPNLLADFNKRDHFSHDRYYHSAGVLANIARNIAKLKTKMERTAAASPAIEVKDFTFINNTELKTILDRDYVEIQRSIIVGNWKSAIILSGGSIEAILLDLLVEDEGVARGSAKAPKEQDLNKWVLNDLIEVAVDTEQVGTEIARLSHSVREYRNLIHPGLELRGTLRVQPEEARIALDVVNILVRDLST